MRALLMPAGSRRAVMAGGLAMLGAGLAGPLHAQTTAKPARLRGRWGDQGDGTFVNPIIPADFSDIDVIRVDDGYVAISSTLHLSPGMTVLRSTDLVNWRIAGHVLPDLGVLGETLTWRAMRGYGRGVWAGAIRHRAGRFRVYFGDPDAGLFVTTAPDLAGPWTPLVRLLAGPGFDDPCPFWDDDGRAWLVATRFAPDPVTGVPYAIHLFPMDPDGDAIDMAAGRIIHQSEGSEANKLYKWNGLYYHYFSEVKREGRVAMMARATSLAGPWEVRQLNHVSPARDKEPNQGGIVQAPSGSWWFLTHQGTGDWEGRALCLLPVTWVDGWPVIGAVGADGIGEMVWSAAKPIAGTRGGRPDFSDDFAAPVLGPQWQWNHAPRAEMWSLSERPGHLRLRAFAPLNADARTVGNVLAQRAWRTSANAVTAQLDLSGMADGQSAGLCHAARRVCQIGVRQSGAHRRLHYADSRGGEIAGPALRSNDLWLRSNWDFAGKADFAFSLDGRAFTRFGPAFQLEWGDYRGDRIGLYSVNPRGDEGHIDIAHFHVSVAAQMAGC